MPNLDIEEKNRLSYFLSLSKYHKLKAWHGILDHCNMLNRI